MSIREASFGDLFKIGFWVQLGPVMIGLLLVGLTFSGFTLLFPDLPRALGEANLVPIPAAAYEAGAGGMIGFIWLVVLAYAAAMAALVTLRTFSGALIVVGWRNYVSRREARTQAA